MYFGILGPLYLYEVKLTIGFWAAVEAQFDSSKPDLSLYNKFQIYNVISNFYGLGELRV